MVDPQRGNRLATPNATILLHQTADYNSELMPSDFSVALLKGMHYAYDGYTDLIAQRSGRALEEVKKDFAIDFWLNPVESILYGSQGLIDGILVGPDTVLTRDTVMDFVVEKFNGNRKAAERYIENKYVERREGNNAAFPEDHQEVGQDPLANPLACIAELTRRGKAQRLSDVERFKKSAPNNPQGETLDWLTVLNPEKKPS
jgi:hypothetical protein